LASANQGNDRLLGFRCGCSTNDRYVLSWYGSVRAPSAGEASDEASLACADYYNRNKNPDYVPPPDSFIEPSDPAQLCADCDCSHDNEDRADQREQKPEPLMQLGAILRKPGRSANPAHN
jgi:hypothetical protein